MNSSQKSLEGFQTTKVLVVLLIIVALCGCGTLETFPTPYGGTVYDTVGFFVKFPLLPFMAMYLVDLPFSFAADTLLLPITIFDLISYEAHKG